MSRNKIILLAVAGLSVILAVNYLPKDFGFFDWRKSEENSQKAQLEQAAANTRLMPGQLEEYLAPEKSFCQRAKEKMREWCGEKAESGCPLASKQAVQEALLLLEGIPPKGGQEQAQLQALLQNPSPTRDDLATVFATLAKGCADLVAQPVLRSIALNTSMLSASDKKKFRQRYTQLLQRPYLASPSVEIALARAATIKAAADSGVIPASPQDRQSLEQMIKNLQDMREEFIAQRMAVLGTFEYFNSNGEALPLPRALSLEATQAMLLQESKLSSSLQNELGSWLSKHSFAF